MNPTDTTRPCAICGLLCHNPLCPNCQETVPENLRFLAVTPEEQWTSRPRFYPPELDAPSFWRVHLNRYLDIRKHGGLSMTPEAARKATPKDIADACQTFATDAAVIERDDALKRYKKGYPPPDEPRWIAKKAIGSWFAQEAAKASGTSLDCNGAGKDCPKRVAGLRGHNPKCRQRLHRA
jgi:hypothetical protein